MSNSSEEGISQKYPDEINLQEIYKALLDHKIFIFSITSLFALISILYALSLPNIYNSEALLMPQESRSSGGGIIDQYSGMASLAGISLPSNTGSSSQEAIARIKSFKFFTDNILPEIALEDLLAVKKWNPANNELIYDESIYNSKSRKWITSTSTLKKSIPSSQEAYSAFKKIITVTEDKKTSFVSLSIKHPSPLIAQKWNQIIIEQIDNSMRNYDKKEAQLSIEYLNKVAQKINYETLKTSLASLQEQQMKKLMMIEAKENYIFEVLDSPLAPEIKSEPSRSKIVIIGSMLGMIFGLLLSLFHYSIISNKKSPI